LTRIRLLLEVFRT